MNSYQGTLGVEKKYTIRGIIDGQRVSLLMPGGNVIDVVAAVKRQYPHFEIMAIHITRGATE